VLSPSNRLAKINRQRVVAISGGTREFWAVDPEKRTVLVTDLTASTIYKPGDTGPATAWRAALAVDDIFAI
jgi:Uma2 family endonuclease